jgi:hypothetical protein
MKIEDEVEVILLDGSVIFGKLLEKRQGGILVKKNEYDAFCREKTISVEIFIPHTVIKKIHKRDLPLLKLTTCQCFLSRAKCF